MIGPSEMGRSFLSGREILLIYVGWDILIIITCGGNRYAYSPWLFPPLFSGS